MTPGSLPLERELQPFAHADPRALLLDTIAGVAELLALTIAVEIGEISRFASPAKLVSSGRSPRPDRPRQLCLGMLPLGFGRLTAPLWN